MDAIAESAMSDLVAAGRTVTNTATVRIDERAGLGSTMKLVTGGKMRPDRFDIVTADGPSGPECVIWPMMAATALPGEYHARLRGALAAPAMYGETLVSSNWQSPERELQKWLRSEKFEAHTLPNEMKQGLTKVNLEHVIDLWAEASDRSRLVITLGGIAGHGSMSAAITVADRLAPSVAMSMTMGPNEPLGGARYASLADAALDGSLFTMSDDAHGSGESASASVPLIDPETRARAIVAAAQPHSGKRMIVGEIDDVKKRTNVFNKVAPGADPAQFLAFFDTGMRAKGKAGIAFFTDAIHVNEMGSNRSARYDEITGHRSASGKVLISVRGGDDVELLVGNETEPVMAVLAAASGQG